MNNLIQKYQPHVKGTLSGWERIVFRGYIKTISYLYGMSKFLQRAGCLLKDFGDYAQAKTEELLLRAENEDRPVRYINSPSRRNGRPT